MGRCMIGWLDGLMIGGSLDGWLVIKLVGWLVGCMFG